MAATDTFYPLPRTTRQAVNPSAAGAALNTGTTITPFPGRVRNWAFHVREAAAGQMGVVVSPTFTGPAIIRSLAWDWTAWTVAAQAGGIQIYCCDVAPTAGIDQSDALAPPGDGVWELSWSDDGGFSAPRFTGSSVGIGTVSGNRVEPIGYVCQKSSFVIAVRLTPRNAAAQVFNGNLVVHEGIPPDQLSSFL